MYDTASKLYNELLETYFDECNELSDATRENIEFIYNPNNLFHKTYKYDPWFENEESTDKKELTDKKESVRLSEMPPLKADEAKEGKGLKSLTPKKLLTRPPILLAQIKAGNNSYKLKNEIRKILYTKMLMRI